MTEDQTAMEETTLLSDHATEVIGVLIMSLTAVVGAWTGFQADRWGGEQVIALAESSTARVAGETLIIEAEQLRDIDSGIFISWLSATVEGEAELADVLSQQFPPTLEEAMEPWLGSDPLANPDAPVTPFDDYTYETHEQGLALTAQANAHQVDALRFARNGQKYTAMAILFATVILFAALAGKVRHEHGRLAMLGLSVIGLLVGVGLVIRMPVAL
ncbi:MAG TPA: hypothetical protein VMM13_19335 [Euzebya sp.]|nr:hypothetical protein [Euzebya sp.]